MLLTNHQRGPVYTEMKHEVEAGGWGGGQKPLPRPLLQLIAEAGGLGKDQ